MTHAAEVFDAQADGYERQRRHLIPPYDDFYGVAVSALELARRPLERILDLGAGTGLLARQVAEARPDARLTLVDAAPEMLIQAERALGLRADCVRADLAAPLPSGRWDAIVSALAVHHLGDEDKRSLMDRAYAALSPGGVFVNAEQVSAPTPALVAVYDDWHRREAQRAGATEQEWAASVERKALDLCATVEEQLGWLRAAGFTDVDCLYRHHCFAVLVAVRP